MATSRTLASKLSPRQNRGTRYFNISGVKGIYGTPIGKNQTGLLPVGLSMRTASNM
jgi:hypothetical protein